MAWKKVTLSSDEVAKGMHFQLQNEFEEVFTAAGAPRHAAMFTYRGSNEPFDYYFSPNGARIFDAGMIKWMALKCEQPESENLTLLVGHSSVD